MRGCAWIVAAIAVVGGVLLVVQTGRRAADRRAAESREGVGEGGGAPGAFELAAAAAESKRGEEVARDRGRTGARAAVDAVATAQLSLRLESAEAPFEVSWNALDNDVVGRFADRADTLELYLLEDRTQRLLTAAGRVRGQGGVVAVPQPSQPLDAGSCVWITHPAALPRVLVLDAGVPSVAKVPPLQPAPTAWITVVDESGLAVGGVRVRQQARPPDDFDAVRAPTEVRARRALIREDVTDEHGRVPRVPMGGPSYLAAIDGVRIAALVTNGEQRDVTLTLGASFRLAGSAPGPCGPWATVSVRAEPGDGGRLAAVTVREDGSFGPFEVRFAPEAAAYVVRLDHGTVEPEERRVDPPAAGALVNVQFEGRPGRALWVLVEDAETAEPIQGALVHWTWSDVGRAQQTTGAEGYADFASLAKVTARLRATAPGYAPFESGGIDLADPELGDIISVAMHRPGRIEGEVVFGERDPSGFLVEFGIDEGGELPGVVKYPRAESGEFVIEGLAPGRYALQGILGDRSPTELVVVEVSAGATARTALPLAPTVSLRGRVVDASDGAPIDGARILTMVMGARAEPLVGLEEWWTDATGRFEVAGVPASNGGLRVERAGFEPYSSVVPELTAGEVFDAGLVALEPLARRQIVLVGSVPDPSSYAVSITGRSDARTHFGIDRLALIDGAASTSSFELHHPEGVVDDHLVYGDPPSGRPLRCFVDPRPVRIEFLRAGRPFADAPLGTLLLYWTDPDGQMVLRHVAGRSFTVTELPGVVSDAVYVVADAGDGWLASERFTAPFDRLVLEFDRPSLDVIVLDAAGEPQSGASVSIDVGEGTRHFGQQSKLTDARGTASFGMPSMGETWLSVRARGFGEILQRRVSRPPEGEPLVVELAPAARIEARLVENDRPVANVRWAIRPLAGPYVARYGVTDLYGRLVAEGFAEDPVVVEAHPPGAWPISRRVAPGAPPLSIEVRRRCDVTLRVLDGEGARVASARVSLVHTAIDRFDRTHGPMGGDVSEWMRGGLVEHVDLVTGVDGELALVGLPSGDYLCRVETSEGFVETRISVKPDSVAPVIVVLG